MAKDFESLKQQALVIKNEVEDGANSSERVGGMLEDIVESMKLGTCEFNVSSFYPTSGISGGNKYDLANAIGQVPAELRTAGLTVSFLNESGDTEKWEFSGGSWAVGRFSQVGAGKLTELEENLHDIEGNLHGNIYDIPAFVSGSEPNYKCYFKKDDLFSINIECNSSLKIFLKDESGNNVPFYHDGTLKTIIESDGNGDYTVIPQSDVYYIRVTDNVDNCNLTIKSIRRTIAELEDYLGADIE